MKNSPSVTVLIPALNEQMHVEACISSLQRQDYPDDRYEIIIVDNGSTDATVPDRA